MIKKIPGKTKPKKKENEGINSVNIREDYSLNEINHLLDQINEVMCEYKADLVGNDPSQMVKTVRGGKVVWITIDEMNEILRKQKKITNPKKPKSKQNTKNFVSDEILSRLQIAKFLVDTIKMLNESDYPEYLKYYRLLETSYYHANSLSRDIQILENAIQRKKKDDPILKEMEGTTAGMIQAIDENNLSQVDVCQSFYNRHYEDYSVKQKLLEPYIKKANETRISYLKTKQKTVEYEYNLYEKGLTYLSTSVEDIIYHDKKGEIADTIVESIINVKKMLEHAKTSFIQISSLTEEEIDENKATLYEFEKDFLSKIVTKSATILEKFRNAWQNLITHPHSDDQITTNSNNHVE